MPASTTVILILLALAGVAVFFVLFARRDPGVQRRTLALEDIGRVYAQISAQAVETSFAVLIIPTGPEENPEIQFSVENGKAGLDWILMSPRNIAEKANVVAYAESRGFEWQEKEMNEWLYMRIEQGDLASLCTSLIRDLYQMGEVELKYGGFKYKA